MKVFYKMYALSQNSSLASIELILEKQCLLAKHIHFVKKVIYLLVDSQKLGTVHLEGKKNSWVTFSMHKVFDNGKLEKCDLNFTKYKLFLSND